jgi:hypothetical protein
VGVTRFNFLQAHISVPAVFSFFICSRVFTHPALHRSLYPLTDRVQEILVEHEVHAGQMIAGTAGTIAGESMSQMHRRTLKSEI